MLRHPLDSLFAPRSIAVVGGSERTGSIGRLILDNLLAGGFKGRLFVVNPAHSEVRGLPSYRSVHELPATPDLSVIAVPAPSVPDVLEACGMRGIRAAIVMSVGFAERGAAGSILQAELAQIARRHRIRLLGPNCIGFSRPAAHTSALLGRGAVRPGRLALVSQSGAVCNAILDWGGAQGIGFSLAASVGNAVDVEFGDVLDYLALDFETSAILVYTEGVGRARRFLSGLRAAARIKPVVVLKAGRSYETREVAATHSGFLLGSDAVFESALRRAGAVRVSTLPQLFSAAELLSERRRSNGNRVAIVTNAGGIGMLAADHCPGEGLVLASLAQPTLRALDEVLPVRGLQQNPVNLLGDASPARYAAAVRSVIQDEHVDGVIALVAPLALTEPLETARALESVSEAKPLLVSFVGGAQLDAARDFLHTSTLREFPGPEAAVEAFGYLASFERNQRMLLEVPGPLANRAAPDYTSARALFDAAQREGRDSLSLIESKALLRAFNIPVTPSIFADSPDGAAQAAEQLGVPVALKIASPDISHKSDVDGVRLELFTLDGVREAYAQLMEQARLRRPDARLLGVTVEPMHGKRFGRELLAGIAADTAFGPVITFGAGGTLVELIADCSVALPPLSLAIARDMIERSRVKALLGELRGSPPADIAAVVDVLLALSELACECPEVQALDINPLVVDAGGVVAVDVRVLLRARDVSVLPNQSTGRYAHCAIEPFPSNLVRTLSLADGRQLLLRPVRPEDAAIEQEFVRKLSGESRYYRFHHGLAQLSPAMLVRFTQIDYDREMSFLALHRDAADREEEVGSCRYVEDAGGESCEFALVVADEWQGHGLGSALMRAIIDHARERGLLRMYGDVLFENHKMLRLMKHLGFTTGPHDEDATLRVVTLSLNDPGAGRLR